MFLVIAVIHNFTEASINKGGLIWFVLLLALMQYPQAQMSHSAAESSPLPEDNQPASGEFVVESAPADNN